MTKLDLIDSHPNEFISNNAPKLSKFELEQLRILVNGDKKRFRQKPPMPKSLSLIDLKIKKQSVLFPKDPEEERLARRKRALFKISKDKIKTDNKISMANIGMLIHKDKKVADVVKYSPTNEPGQPPLKKMNHLGRPGIL